MNVKDKVRDKREHVGLYLSPRRLETFSEDLRPGHAKGTQMPLAKPFRLSPSFARTKSEDRMAFVDSIGLARLSW